MYAASLGFTLLVILSAIWGQYIKLRFSGDFYASYDKVGMIVVIAVMAVTVIGCFVRDRLELVKNIYEFESQLADKIPSVGFYSVKKTDIVEDKYFEKEADLEKRVGHKITLNIMYYYEEYDL